LESWSSTNFLAYGVDLGVKSTPLQSNKITGWQWFNYQSVLWCCGPFGNIPIGRNWERFSLDLYLTGVAMQQTITRMQDLGVQACAKHCIGDEQEKNRDTMSANIDDRTIHELYLWPFADAVQAGSLRAGPYLSELRPRNRLCGYRNIRTVR